MLLDHRDRVDKWKEHLGKVCGEYCPGGTPLGRLRDSDTGSGQEPGNDSMCQSNRGMGDGTWRERLREMLIDGSVLCAVDEEYCREVTGGKYQQTREVVREAVGSQEKAAGRRKKKENRDER